MTRLSTLPTIARLGLTVREDLLGWAGAAFDESEAHRYLCWRVWHPGLPLAAWMGLNPSTADDVSLDATLRRIEGYSRAWGFGGFVMTNTETIRSTDPAGLWALPPRERSAPGHDDLLRELLALPEVELLLCCWGPGSKATRKTVKATHDARVAQLWAEVIEPAPVPAGALVLCSRGHPLYLDGGLRPRAYRYPGELGGLLGLPRER